jgi:hypothetical protein
MLLKPGSQAAQPLRGDWLISRPICTTAGSPPLALAREASAVYQYSETSVWRTSIHLLVYPRITYAAKWLTLGPYGMNVTRMVHCICWYCREQQLYSTEKGSLYALIFLLFECSFAPWTHLVQQQGNRSDFLELLTAPPPPPFPLFLENYILRKFPLGSLLVYYLFIAFGCQQANLICWTFCLAPLLVSYNHFFFSRTAHLLLLVVNKLNFCLELMRTVELIRWCRSGEKKKKKRDSWKRRYTVKLRVENLSMYRLALNLWACHPTLEGKKAIWGK